jgi:cytochrome c-type biogenesis protein CcmH
MMLQTFSMAALAALALLWLTRPLWRRHADVHMARRQANVTAYQVRLAELQRDVAAGVVPASELPALQQELDARLLADAAQAERAEPSGTRPTVVATWVLSALLLIASALWYWQAGSWRTAQQIAAGPAPAATPDNAQIAAMVAQLAARLQAKPDDAEGWAMLGRSYFVMQRYADATKAYGEANTRSRSSKADWLTDEGEATALAGERDLQGRPQELFAAALKLEPENGKALWYSGLAAAQAGDNATARRHWQALLAQDVPDDIRAAVNARLAELGGAATASAAPDAAASGQPLRLNVQVTLKPELAAKLKPDQVLFLFAKAAQGPPMPLAVQRIPGATLPITLTLDDSQAMMPSMKLSNFQRWIITARLSSSGGAKPEAGDLQGSVTVSAAEASKPVQVEIGEVVAAP